MRRAGSTTRGVALVITLIMLAVITFMAVTFLVLTNRQRGQVNTYTDSFTARNAADSAMERATAELLARILVFTNDQNFDMIVSTNYYNPLGFVRGLQNIPEYTNVNYDRITSGGALNVNDLLQNLGNLYWDPRPPVIMTNRLLGKNEFRFYWDLNRNGQFDPNGFQPVISPDPAKPYYDLAGNLMAAIQPGNTLSNFFVGDPEWIGVLARPGWPHSSSNHFLARFAYLVIPAGKTLDMNYIHNQAITKDASIAGFTQDGFLRNEGVGSWEINFASFLADLNTNIWYGNGGNGYYQYNRWRALGTPNQGIAFSDAFAMLRYRYAFNYGTLLGGYRGLLNNGVDDYSDGPMMLGTVIPPDIEPTGPNGAPWVGSDNVNHFFTTQDFFDRGKIQAPGFTFVDRMLNVGTNVDSYNRYTFYRMLQQLGTDSAPDNGKIDINYKNVDARGTVVPGMQTNFFAWTNACEFFTNAADRLLRTNTAVWASADLASFQLTFGKTNAFGIGEIPVYWWYRDPRTNSVIHSVSGYTPAVHRILQVVANIYDATTNQGTLSDYPYLPHVYRPIFRRDTNTTDGFIYIAGYREVVDTAIIKAVNQFTAPRMLDISDFNQRQLIPLVGTAPQPDANEPMVFGIPLVIGARKGLPNFNKFALQNAITVTRKLQFHRASGQPVSQTNQVYSLSISNMFGYQLWNSYSNVFPRNLQVRVVSDILMSVTNQFGAILDANGAVLNGRIPLAVGQTNILIPANTWAGFVSPQQTISFRVPLVANWQVVTNSDFSVSQNRFLNSSLDAANTFPVPQWWLNVTNRVRAAIIDTTANRIVDYVNLSKDEPPISLIGIAGQQGNSSFRTTGAADPDPGMLWVTNRVGNPMGNLPDNPSSPTYGEWEQILISLGTLPVSDSFWLKYNANSSASDKQDSINRFIQRLFSNSQTTDPLELTFEAPFDPTRTIYQYARWEANDPLVHYTVPDLTDLLVNATNMQWDANNRNPVVRLGTGNPLSDHYRPWGGNPNNPAETSVPSRFRTELKDPLVMRSDHWDFPTNKFTLGLLGRVHRGTPWQTVYLKSMDSTNSNWALWSGNTNLFDAINSKPISDRLLFDVFTTAMNDNATRGSLSVNQTGLAAWSAVLGGVVVLTNSVTGAVGPYAIPPAGVYTAAAPSPVAQIVAGINNTRALQVPPIPQNAPPPPFAPPIGPPFAYRVFNHVGDILATPQLTDQSPFLANPTAANDEVLERIPQQIMSLLSCNHTPRFVIYAVGQTLHPAPASVYVGGVGGGAYFQMVTNYLPAAETALRAVVHVEGSFDPQQVNNPVPALRYPPHVVVEQFNILPPD